MRMDLPQFNYGNWRPSQPKVEEPKVVYASGIAVKNPTPESISSANIRDVTPEPVAPVSPVSESYEQAFSPAAPTVKSVNAAPGAGYKATTLAGVYEGDPLAGKISTPPIAIAAKPSTLASFLPYAVVGGLVFFILRKRR